MLSRIQSWCIQRVSSLGLVAIIALACFALIPSSNDSNDGSLDEPAAPTGSKLPRLSSPQFVFVCYTLVAHILALGFPLRLCWATYSITKRLYRTAARYNTKLYLDRRSSSGSTFKTEKYEDSTSFSSSSSSSSIYSESTCVSPVIEGKHQWLLHTIIVPNYKEELDILRETLEVLACHPNACTTYEICLAMEQAESNAHTKAAILVNEYSSKFRSVDYTIHPKGIPGEAQGKSSNLCWAAKYVNGKHETNETKQNTIITVIDADSHLSATYFDSINETHQQYPDTAQSTLYVPPIIFDRNAHLVPTLVRVADILWAGAGLSGHHMGSSICPPTSVYSLPLSLVDRAGGWDAGEETIGEDLHMYIKCFYALNGNLTTRTVLSAASHSNVHTGDKGIRGFFRDLKARYKQALRHMWGALDSGFALKSALVMLWESRQREGKLRPNWLGTLVLLHRMYEAHFLPTHITILIIAGGLYTLLVPPSQIPPLLLNTLNATGWLRLGSGATFGIFFILYESYHFICVSGREREMIRAGLADRMAGYFSYRSRRHGSDFCVFPIAGMLFGSVPTIVALVCQLWTLNIVYSVSKKPSWAAVVAP